MKGSSVRLTDVSKTYRRGAAPTEALKRVTIAVPAGTTCAVVGQSGSGKSTMLHLIGALDRPDLGQVMVDDVLVNELRSRHAADFRSSVGFVFQQFHLIPVLSVLDNVLAPLVGRHPGFDPRARARELLDRVGLANKIGALPSQLSGGEQQRVAIARALIWGPRLVLADEPTGNLDSMNGARVVELLREVNIDQGTTVMIATHDAEVAKSLTHVITMHDGRAEQAS